MTVRLAHLSDIHFGGENAPAVAAAAEHLNAEAYDLVVVSGDLTRFGEAKEFAAARDWLAALLEEDGFLMHGLEAGEVCGRVGHDEPPQGTCSKNFMPALTRSLAPGLSGVSRPSSLMNSRT